MNKCVFSLDLKEDREDESLRLVGREFQTTGPCALNYGINTSLQAICKTDFAMGCVGEWYGLRLVRVSLQCKSYVWKAGMCSIEQTILLYDEKKLIKSDKSRLFNSLPVGGAVCGESCVFTVLAAPVCRAGR